MIKEKVKSGIQKPEPKLFSGDLLITIPVKYKDGKGVVHTPVVQPKNIIDVKTLREILKLADKEIVTKIENELLLRKI